MEAFDTTRLLLPMKNRSSSYSVRVSTTGFPFTLTDLTGEILEKNGRIRTLTNDKIFLLMLFVGTIT